MKIIVKRSTVLTIILIINKKPHLIWFQMRFPTATFTSRFRFQHVSNEHTPCTHFRFRGSSIFIEGFKGGKFIFIFFVLSYYSTRKASLRYGHVSSYEDREVGLRTCWKSDFHKDRCVTVGESRGYDKLLLRFATPATSPCLLCEGSELSVSQRHAHSRLAREPRTCFSSI